MLKIFTTLYAADTPKKVASGYLLGLTLGNAALGVLDLLKHSAPAFSMVMPISGIGLALMDLKVRVKSLRIARKNIRKAAECEVNDKEVIQFLHERAHKEQMSVVYGLGYTLASVTTTVGLILPPLMLVGAAMTGTLWVLENKERVAQAAKAIVKGAARVAKAVATTVVTTAIAGAKSIFSTVKNFLFGKKPVVKEAVQLDTLAVRMTNGATMMRTLTTPSAEPRTRAYVASSRTPNAPVTPRTQAAAPIYLNTRASQNRNSMYAQQNQAPVAKDVVTPRPRAGCLPALQVNQTGGI